MAGSGTSIEIFRFKLDELDKKIALARESAIYKAYRACEDKGAASGSIFFGGSINATVYVNGQTMSCRTLKMNSQWKAYQKLMADRAVLLTEMEKEAQFLKDQSILQENEATAKAKAEVLRALAEVEKAKTENEKLRAEAALEAARTAAAQKLGESEAGRGVLLGQQRRESIAKPLLYTGLVLGAGILGFVVYKIIK